MFFSKSQLTQVESPLTLIPKCEKCRLYTQCQTPKMKFAGQGKKEILIILDGVTAKDDAAGIPGTGDAKVLFNRYLKPLGIDYEVDCWRVPAVICHSPKVFMGAAEAERIINSCRPNLINTINELNPKIIIVSGSVALKSLLKYLWRKTGEDTTTQIRWAGWRIPSQQLNAWVCPILNPLQVAKEKNPLYDFYLKESLKEIAKLDSRPWKKVPDWKSEVQIINDIDDIIKKLKYFKTLPAISFDYETNCLKPDNPEGIIYCCSMSDGETTIAFPMKEKVVPYVKDILFDANIKKSGWNIQFEDRWTYAKLGQRVRGWDWDGMVNNHLIDNRDDINSLKFQAFVRLGVPIYSDDTESFLEADGGYGINRINDAGWSRLLLYNGLDSLLENKITKIQKKLLGM